MYCNYLTQFIYWSQMMLYTQSDILSKSNGIYLSFPLMVTLVSVSKSPTGHVLTTVFRLHRGFFLRQSLIDLVLYGGLFGLRLQVQKDAHHEGGTAFGFTATKMSPIDLSMMLRLLITIEPYKLGYGGLLIYRSQKSQ